MARQIRYRKKDVVKLFLVWLLVFSVLVCWNIGVARGERNSSVPVLSGWNALILIPHWAACLVYSLVLFVFLRDGQRFWRFPVFIILQLAWLVFDQGADAFDFVRRTWHDERYMLAPFAYSVVVYLLVQAFRKRLCLCEETAYQEEKLNKDESPER
ncbi:hypothetical protein [Taibaiella koreensis]|uniref:hypothetical protein n=1 Tax=Taibaiella koreensis TaxID=1268548 RepID=UPI000E59A303|nr:hypothetical protein [Taibaiella koreensis]